jgi:hypothetical protein
MLVPGLDYQPLEEITNLDSLPVESKVKIFSSTYQNHVCPQEKHRQYFKRYGYGRIYKTVNRLAEKYVFTERKLTATELAAILEDIYTSGIILTGDIFAKKYADYNDARKEE